MSGVIKGNAYWCHLADTETFNGVDMNKYSVTLEPSAEDMQNIIAEATTVWEEFAEKAKNNFTILLHHQPEYIAEDAKKTDIDLIVCGHTHGGQIQLPFIGGVIAPNQGLFPKYDKGEFDLDGTKMIVCAGLSNTVFIPRINNQVEIGVVTVV